MTTTQLDVAKVARPSHADRWEMRRTRLVANVVVAFVLVGAWWALSKSVRYMAPPGETARELLDGLSDGWILEGVGSTVVAAGTGFLGACLIGVPLGYLLAVRPFFGKVMTPIVQAYGSVPRIIFLPILLVLFGVGETAKTTMALLAAIFPIVINLAASVAATPTSLERLAAALQLGPISHAFKIRLRGSIPALIAGARLGLSSAILAVIVSEFFGAPDGLGVQLAKAYGSLDYTRLFAIMTVILVISVTANAVLAALERSFRS